MPKRMSVSDLLRRACHAAELNTAELIAAYANCTDPASQEFIQEEKDFLSQLVAYRTKRWGKGNLETVLDSMVEVSVIDLMAESREVALAELTAESQELGLYDDNTKNPLIKE